MSTTAQEEIAQMSDDVTDFMLSLPQLGLDEIVYTVMYSYTAQSFTSDISDCQDLMRTRYRERSDLLEADVSAAPLVLKRLERLAGELPEESVTAQFAQKYIPYVTRFGQELEDYTKSR